MKSQILKLSGVLALTMAAQPALAAHVIVYAPRTDAYASSAAIQGPNYVGSTQSTVNGAVVTSSAGNGGTATGGGSATNTFSQTTQPGGFGQASITNESFASANLNNGTLKATTLSTGPNVFGAPVGMAQARLDDTIFFTNNSGLTQTISLTYHFDGQMTDPFGGNPGGLASLVLSCGGNLFGCNNGVNGAGDNIMFAKSNGDLALLPNETSVVPFDSTWHRYFNMNGGCFGENQFCGQFSSDLWEYGLNGPNTGGQVDAYIRAYLNVPTGLTSLGVSGRLNLDCRGGSSCDFGNTGSFSFGALPGGVTYGSASGVFLTANAPGAIPEPATWAMMIIGFGAAGSVIRRRRAVSVA
jgi:hypothetical protein